MDAKNKIPNRLELKYNILDTELTKSSPGPSKAGSFKCGKCQCKNAKSWNAKILPAMQQKTHFLSLLNLIATQNILYDDDE